MQPVKSPFRDSLSNALLELKGIDGTVWEWLYNVSISSKAKQLFKGSKVCIYSYIYSYISSKAKQLFGFKGVHAMQ